MKGCGIYAIVNLVTNDMYIGSAVCMARRWRMHRHYLKHGRHHCTHLQNAFAKYSPDNFSFEVIEFVDLPTNLIAREQFWLDFFAPAYNKRKIANSCLGSKRTAEARARMSESRRGIKQSPETIAKRAAALRGRPRPPEVRAKISASRMGLKPTAETRIKLSLAKRKIAQEVRI